LKTQVGKLKFDELDFYPAKSISKLIFQATQALKIQFQIDFSEIKYRLTGGKYISATK
jgi:hypothetical protein